MLRQPFFDFVFLILQLVCQFLLVRVHVSFLWNPVSAQLGHPRWSYGPRSNRPTTHSRLNLLSKEPHILAQIVLA